MSVGLPVVLPFESLADGSKRASSFERSGWSCCPTRSSSGGVPAGGRRDRCGPMRRTPARRQVRDEHDRPLVSVRGRCAQRQCHAWRTTRISTTGSASPSSVRHAPEAMWESQRPPIWTFCMSRSHGGQPPDCKRTSATPFRRSRIARRLFGVNRDRRRTGSHRRSSWGATG